MKKIFALALFGFLFFLSKAQDSTYKAFEKDFRAALDTGFTEGQLDTMFHRYLPLLTPHSDVTRLMERLKGHMPEVFPLYDFKSENLYKNNIKALLYSRNANQRILAYLVVASSGDTTQEGILLDKINTETISGCLIWSGMALLYLKCDRTTPLFDFLVKNEDFGDAHMLPLYIKLNPDSLQQTAYKRIRSDNMKSRILAAQILSVTKLNPHTDSLLREAVKNWDLNVKGYAIFSVKELRMGNLLRIMKPLLDSSETRGISMEALANSPTPSDRDYLISLLNKKDTADGDIMDALYKSKNIENIKYWLKLLYTKPIPKQYIFFVMDQPLMFSDSLLPDIQTALIKIKNPEIKGELVRSLVNREDDKSVNIMISLLSDTNSTVKYWTARTLQDNHSPKLQSQKVKDLITDGLKDN